MPSRRWIDSTTALGFRNTSTAHTSPSTRRHSGRVRHVRGSFHAHVPVTSNFEIASVSCGNNADALGEYSHPARSLGGKSHERPNAARMASLHAVRDLLSQWPVGLS